MTYPIVPGRQDPEPEEPRPVVRPRYIPGQYPPPPQGGTGYSPQPGGPYLAKPVAAVYTPKQSKKRWGNGAIVGTIVIVLLLLLGVIGGIATIAGGDQGQGDAVGKVVGSNAPAAPEPGTGGEAPEKPEPVANDGTDRTKPLKPGQSFLLPDWRITVGKTTSGKAAADIIRKENMFNDMPLKGNTFVIASVTLERIGGEPNTPWVDIAIRFVTPDGLTIDGGIGESYCGVVPKSITDVGEMFPGAKTKGNACLQVPVSAVAKGTWVIEPMFRQDRRIYIATKG